VSTYRRAGEIAELASVLLVEYQPGQPLHDLFREDVERGDSDGATFTIHVRAVGRELSGLVASFDAIQLAFDAAAVAFAFDREFGDQPRDNLEFGVLESFAFAPIGSLEIYELSDGSFFGKFVAVFRDPITRSGVSAVGGLTVIALHIICPALIVPTAIIGGVSSVTPVASAVLDRHLKKKEDAAREQAGAEARKRDADAARAKDEAAAERERILSERIERLEEIHRAHGGTLVDNDAVLEAGAKATMKITDDPPEGE
jgi:hypothetical protein